MYFRNEIIVFHLKKEGRGEERSAAGGGINCQLMECLSVNCIVWSKGAGKARAEVVIVAI